jgi:hypothetical protein
MAVGQYIVVLVLGIQQIFHLQLVMIGQNRSINE